MGTSGSTKEQSHELEVLRLRDELGDRGQPHGEVLERANILYHEGVLGELFCFRPRGCVPLQAATHEATELWRKACWIKSRFWAATEVVEQGYERRDVVKRESTGRHLVDDHANTPDVRREGVVFPLTSLGRHVGLRSANRKGELRRRVQQPCYSKVCQLHLAQAVQQHVLRLDISMQKPPGVQVFEAPRHLHCEAREVAGRHALPAETDLQVIEAAHVHEFLDDLHCVLALRGESRIPLNEVRAALCLDKPLDFAEELVALLLAVHPDRLDGHAATPLLDDTHLDRATAADAQLRVADGDIFWREVVVMALENDAAVC
mmetsp:Transcript_29887/g.65194  ORF Transcript_29887/g.65194 Transcript_29887/m.65194 type:complete len:319 (+) Transcript_29887:184-1140(+)